MMLNYGKQILHWLVLLVTGIALIGVNVTQSNCMHSRQVYLEVKVLPSDRNCPCDDGCACCKGSERICEDCCHTSARHTFYKVTDSSVVERSVQMAFNLFFLPDSFWKKALELPFPEEQAGNFLVFLKIPDVPPSPEILCTFLC